MPQLSFYVTNLLIPGDPKKMTIATPSGGWKLEQAVDFVSAKAAITARRGQQAAELPIANTYILEHSTFPQPGREIDERALAELTPILLAASYASGMSVTIRDGTLAGPCLMGNPTDSWPRARAMNGPSWVVSTEAEFQCLIEAFMKAWPTAGMTEKALLLVHHWLDALSCWSMEDLYLSATTLLQIIVATEATKLAKRRMDFRPGIEASTRRYGLKRLDKKFKKMRDDLVHEGRLIGAGFGRTGADRSACNTIVADVLNWFDAYMHAALGLGPVAKTRFQGGDFIGLNAYSI